jgi:hypothetical protein
MEVKKIGQKVANSGSETVVWNLERNILGVLPDASEVDEGHMSTF